MSSRYFVYLLLILGVSGWAEAPTGLRSTVSDSRVVLEWDNPNDASISHYQWAYKPSTGLWSQWADIASSDANTTTLRASGLVNGVSYRFRIRAIEGNVTRQTLINGNRNDAYFPVNVGEHGAMYLDLGKDVLSGISIASYLATNGSPPPLTQDQYNNLSYWQSRFTVPDVISNGYIERWKPWQTPWVNMSVTDECKSGNQRICFRMQGLSKNTWHLYQFRMVFHAVAREYAESRNTIPGDPELKLTISGVKDITPDYFEKGLYDRRSKQIIFIFSERVTGFDINDIDIECGVKYGQLYRVGLMSTIDGMKDIYKIRIKPTKCNGDQIKVRVPAGSVMYEASENMTPVTRPGPKNDAYAYASCELCSNTQKKETSDQEVQTAPQSESSAEEPVSCVDDSLKKRIVSYTKEQGEHTPHVRRWREVLAAFGEKNGHEPMGSDEAQTYLDKGWMRWKPVVTTLKCLEKRSGFTLNAAQSQTPTFNFQTNRVFVPNSMNNRGVLRVQNNSDISGRVVITPISDYGRSYSPITLYLDANEAVNLDGFDMEYGNPDKGLPKGVGSGINHIEIDSDIDITTSGLLLD